MSEKYPFGTFGPEHLKKIQPGIQAFNEQRYWECHEELEHVWLEDRGDTARLVYWAIIQVAASMVHYRDQKLIGCIGMMNKAKEKFKRCHEKKVLTPLVWDYLDWKELETMVFKIPENPNLEDFSAIYEFRFKKYPY
jgi:hypothetical protein